MTSYRFRVKALWNPRGLYRDIVIGSNRTLEDLQIAINNAFGLDFDHFWFFAVGLDYWQSRVRYLSPWELETPDKWEELFDFFTGRVPEKKHGAAEVTIGELNLALRDRMCYLFDYGDEWRFYMILEERRYGDPSDKPPVVVKKMGDDVVQYVDYEDEPEDSPDSDLE